MPQGGMDIFSIQHLPVQHTLAAQRVMGWIDKNVYSQSCLANRCLGVGSDSCRRRCGTCQNSLPRRLHLSQAGKHPTSCPSAGLWNFTRDPWSVFCEPAAFSPYSDRPEHSAPGLSNGAGGDMPDERNPSDRRASKSGFRNGSGGPFFFRFCCPGFMSSH